MAICLRNFTIAMLILLGSSSQAQELLKVPVAIPAVRPAATTFVVSRDRRYYREEAVSVSCESEFDCGDCFGYEQCQLRTHEGS